MSAKEKLREALKKVEEAIADLTLLRAHLDSLSESQPGEARKPPGPLTIPKDTFEALRAAYFIEDTDDALQEIARILDSSIATEPGEAEAVAMVPARTLCPECGPGVDVDEDGLCATCGATASGPWAEKACAALRASAGPDAETRRKAWNAADQIEESAGWLCEDEISEARAASFVEDLDEELAAIRAGLYPVDRP